MIFVVCLVKFTVKIEFDSVYPVVQIHYGRSGYTEEHRITNNGDDGEFEPRASDNPDKWQVVNSPCVDGTEGRIKAGACNQPENSSKDKVRFV